MSEEHFLEKGPWTQLKHNLLKTVLSASLEGTLNSNFTYIDGFAGSNTFDDGAFGSPSIAMDTIIDYLNNNSRKKSLLVNSIFFELKEDMFLQLEGSIQKYLGINDRLKIILKNYDFYSGNQQASLMSCNGSGLIFIDPFGIRDYSTKPIEFCSTINSNFDVLINFPFYPMKRVVGQGTNSRFQGSRDRLETALELDYDKDNGKLFDSYINVLKLKYPSVNVIDLNRGDSQLYKLILCTKNLAPLIAFNDYKSGTQPSLLSAYFSNTINSKLSKNSGIQYRRLFIELLNENFGMISSSLIKNHITKLFESGSLCAKKSSNGHYTYTPKDFKVKELEYLQLVV